MKTIDIKPVDTKDAYKLTQEIISENFDVLDQFDCDPDVIEKAIKLGLNKGFQEAVNQINALTKFTDIQIIVE